MLCCGNVNKNIIKQVEVQIFVQHFGTYADHGYIQESNSKKLAGKVCNCVFQSINI